MAKFDVEIKDKDGNYSLYVADAIRPETAGKTVQFDRKARGLDPGRVNSVTPAPIITMERGTKVIRRI